MGASGHPVLLIAGPTASGKSALALDLAGRFGGEIVNADSMQVYRDLRILTARPPDEDMVRVPHHLFGHVDAAERYSVGRWLEDARAAIADIRGRNRIPLVVGGTGLYFRALTKGLADVPPPGEAAEAQARALLAEHGMDGLRAEAERLDVDATARVAAGDRQRLLRIVAVALGTGRTLSEWQKTAAERTAPAWRGTVLEIPAAALNARIESRLRMMLAQGGIEEARRLMARGLDPDLPAMKALGVAEFAALARGEIGEEEAIERAVIATRQYAKRQRTWFRTQTPDWARVEAQGPGAAAQLARALGLG